MFKTLPKDQRGAELHETPPEAVFGLVEAEPWLQQTRWLWEPACGPGAMVRALASLGHAVAASDKHSYQDSWSDFDPAPASGVDFLDSEATYNGSFDAVITNPPFSMADAFVECALQVAPRAYMLLPITWLEGGAASPIRDRIFGLGQLTGLFPSRERIPLHRHDYKGREGRWPMVTAWMRFDRDPEGVEFRFQRISLRGGRTSAPAALSDLSVLIPASLRCAMDRAQGCPKRTRSRHDSPQP